ncbi:interleukin-21 receptor [Phycodurus eques]|uniref:interleukin-21 receptor n=1 Tax=Phycodurus eques TaxID=693459 RepID=UPI002ACE10FC|nr:interleukin-21 receptor [Phycodurus eques]
MAQLKLMLLLLHAGRVYGLPVTGMRVSLECDNDFMFTINCSLNLTSAQDGPRWLTFEKKYANREYECTLSNASGGRRSCSVTTATTTPEDSSPVKTFVDYDLFQISLCGEKRSDGADRGCQMLDDSYKPAAHIKPNAPCCLAVSHNSSRRHFTWNNTYEEILFSTLKENLKYQLCFYKRWDRHGVRVHSINTDDREYSVADSDLEMDTEYCTKVRSAPRAAPFQGKWSDWSQEVHWRTDWANDDGFLSKNAQKVFLASGVTAALVLILCCASLIRWRQGAFVPTPAPYFQSLYGECHGDFKSWVDTPANMTITLKPEETLQVDSHEEESPARDHQAGLEYKNTSRPVRKAPPARSIASSVGLPPSEEKAQCGPSGVPLIQREAPRYCHEYCTLSVSQQPEPTTGKVASVAVKHTGRSEYH